MYGTPRAQVQGHVHARAHAKHVMARTRSSQVSCHCQLLPHKGVAQHLQRSVQTLPLHSTAATRAVKRTGGVSEVARCFSARHF